MNEGIAATTTAAATYVMPKVIAATTNYSPDPQWFYVSALGLLLWMLKRMIDRFESRLVANSAEHKEIHGRITDVALELKELKGEHEGHFGRRHED